MTDFIKKGGRFQRFHYHSRTAFILRHNDVFKALLASILPQRNVKTVIKAAVLDNHALDSYIHTEMQFELRGMAIELVPPAHPVSPGKVVTSDSDRVIETSTLQELTRRRRMMTPSCPACRVMTPVRCVGFRAYAVMMSRCLGADTASFGCCF
jgi:hypothetical protein